MRVSQLSWFSHLYGSADGYGSSAEQVIIELEKKNVRVYPEGPFGLSCEETFIRPVLERPPVTCSVRVAYAPPFMDTNISGESKWQRRYLGQAIVGYTMFEDSKVPQVWEDPMKIPDVIAVPTDNNVRVFQEFCDQVEIKTPVVKIPLGVNASYYPLEKRKWLGLNGETDKPLTFLWTAARLHEERKGARNAYLAFRDAFTLEDNVAIIFRAAIDTYVADHDPEDDWFREAQNDPRVTFLFGRISNKQKAEILRGVHCLLYPSHGEGFGLIPLECAAAGIPSIVTGNTSMDDYAKDLKAMISVPSDSLPSGIWTRWQMKSRGLWQKPRHDELIRALRNMRENYGHFADRAMGDGAVVRAKWNYGLSADAMIAACELALERRTERHRILRSA